jgi:tetratricopeptide (TPR) repeat protein
MKINGKIIVLALFFLALLLVSYSNHFQNGFHFDDMHTIVNNVHIKDIKNIPAFFTDPKMFSISPAHWGLRPIVTTSTAIDYWLGGGLNPFYFHLSTFLWHIMLCCLLFFLYRKILDKSDLFAWAPYAAIISSGWFALHTVNAETLNYIIARSDVLSTLCIVASFSIYVFFPNKRKWFLYAIPAMACVFAKETALMIVPILFFYTWLFEKEMALQDLFKPEIFKKVLQTVVSLLPVFFMVAVVQYYTLSHVKTIDGVTNPVGYYLLTQTYVWLRYFLAFFIPGHLSADSDWGVITNIFDERIIIGLIFVTLLVIAIFKASNNKATKPIAFGLIWFVASLLPTSLIPFAEVTNDHRMYFAFVGLAFSVISFIAWQLQKYELRNGNLGKTLYYISTVLFLVIALNAYGVYQRNKVWKNEASLWYDVTVKSPANGRGLMNYGLTQMEIGNYQVANEYFQKALIYNPNYHTLFINIGILKAATGLPLEAESNFQKAISYGSNYFEPYAFYAKFLKDNGRWDEAIAMTEKALTINPFSVMALDVLMNAYLQTGSWNKLIETANKVLSFLPASKNALAFLEAAKNKTTIPGSDAIVQKPFTAEKYLDLSLTYYNQKEYEKCIDACNQALKLKPNFAEAYNNIGAAYNQMGLWQKGIEACTKALQINPNNKLAKANLDWAKGQLKIKP